MGMGHEQECEAFKPASTEARQDCAPCFHLSRAREADPKARGGALQSRPLPSGHPACNETRSGRIRFPGSSVPTSTSLASLFPWGPLFYKKTIRYEVGPGTLSLTSLCKLTVLPYMQASILVSWQDGQQLVDQSDDALIRVALYSAGTHEKGSWHICKGHSACSYGLQMHHRHPCNHERA